MLALKPYWGKLTVRNFRGDDGNVGIIRSPVRAIALLDNLRNLIVGEVANRNDSQEAPALVIVGRREDYVYLVPGALNVTPRHQLSVIH